MSLEEDMIAENYTSEIVEESILKDGKKMFTI